MKVLPAAAEVFHADKRMDRLVRLIDAFHNFADAPKKKKSNYELVL